MTRQEMLPVCLAKNSNKVGGTKATLLKFLIENGNRGLNEIVQNVGTDARSRNAIRTCLYRSRLQGLVIRDEYGGYSFNPNAVQFCSLISEQMRNSLERAGYTPPPPKPDGNSTPVSDKIERESFTSHVHELHDSYMTATDELHDDINSITDGTSLGQIGHNPVLDPMKAGPPPQSGYGGGSGYGPNSPARAVGRSATPEKFIPLSWASFLPIASRGKRTLSPYPASKKQPNSASFPWKNSKRRLGISRTNARRTILTMAG
jgi:hypothetical protein